MGRINLFQLVLIGLAVSLGGPTLAQSTPQNMPMQHIEAAPAPMSSASGDGAQLQNDNVPRAMPVPNQATPGFPNDNGQNAAPDKNAMPTSALQPCLRPQANPAATNGDVTYHKDDLIGAGEGVFGKGAKGLAQIIERILKRQGEPDAYIAGHEASGAFVVGVRYGSGALCHNVEGQRPVYWTGPSLGFDVGGDATKVFVLVYNLYDSQALYRRYGEVEGSAFYVGGLSATYLRRGNIVLIPIRLGVGLRLGANIGYMKFREKNSWSPF